jgi:hypothetical protein
MNFNIIYAPHEGLCVAVKVDDKKKETKFGFLDESKREVIPFIYDYVGGFEKDGTSYAELGGEKFFIDKAGKRSEKKVREYKVAGWTRFKDEKYEKLETAEEWILARDALVKYMREKGIKFDGHHHQNGYDGVPVFDNGKKYCVSLRSWGALMSEVLEYDNSDGMAYCNWAWSDDDTPVYPNGRTEEEDY